MAAAFPERVQSTGVTLPDETGSDLNQETLELFNAETIVGNNDGACQLTIDRVREGHPGAPIQVSCSGLLVNNLDGGLPPDLVWAPFTCQRDWDIAYWAKTRGPSSSALAEFLAIPGV